MDVNHVFKMPSAAPLDVASLGKKRKMAAPTSADLDRAKEKMHKSAHEDSSAHPAPRFPRIAEEQNLSEEQRELLDTLETAQEFEAGKLTPAQIKKLMARFGKAVKANTDARLRHAASPELFMESEADLSIATRDLFVVGDSPELFETVTEPAFLESLVGLLIHENADIGLLFLDLMNEWTSEDVESNSKFASARAQSRMKEFLDAILALDAIPACLTFVGRLVEEAPADAERAAFSLLETLQNIAELETPRYPEFIIKQEGVLKWLFSLMVDVDKLATAQLSAELLEVLLMNSDANRRLFVQRGMLEPLLKLLARYRKRDPENLEQEEYVDNLWNLLCSALTVAEGKSSFAACAGAELMVIMLQNGRRARVRAIKALNFVTSSADRGQRAATENCAKLVDAGGLGQLFGILMGKDSAALRKAYKGVYRDAEDEEHVLTTVQSLLWHLNDAAPHYRHSRVVRKLVENGGQKLQRLCVLYAKYRTKLVRVEARLEAERDDYDGDEEDFREECYIQRLESGLSVLYSVCAIFGETYVSGFAECREITLRAIDEAGISVHEITKILQEMHDNMDASALEAERARIHGFIDILQKRESE